MPTLDRPFTKRIVDALPTPAQRTLYWEGGSGSVKRFGCKVEPTGRKVFIYQYDAVGRQSRRITLGAYGALTIEQGRALAREQATRAAKARNDPAALDPAQTRAARRAAVRAEVEAPNVATLFDRFLADRERRGTKAATLAEYRRVLGVTTQARGPHAGEARPGVLRAAIGDRKVSEINRKDVQAIHDAHEATAPAMARRYVDLLAACFTFAEAEEWRGPGTNPCRHVRRAKLVPRRQSLREEDYQALGRALADAERVGLPAAPARQSRSRGVSAARRAKVTGRTRGPYKRAAERTPTPQNPIALAMLRFLALSGWRSDEAKRLLWTEIDAARAVAVLPDTKSGRSTRPLGSAALDVLVALRRRPDYPAGSAYVFPSLVKIAAPMTEVDHVWAAVRHAAGISITLHGLRHAFTTTARFLGYGDHVIARIVGHVLNDTMTSRYGDVPDRQVAEAAERIATYIANMLSTTGHEAITNTASK